MSEMEEKLGAILNNPAMMQQIMSLAQSMGQSAPASPPQPAEPAVPVAPNLFGLAKGSAVDQDQQNLLNALSPYLSHGRVEKLERAMRAAKMAGTASSLLQSGALQNILGR